MSKKKQHHDEHVNHERWLVSYADFITLLFAFFVVLFSSSQTDRSKVNKMSLAIQAAFSEFSLFKDRGGELNLMSSADATSKTAAMTSGKSLISQEGQPIFMAPTIVDDADSKVRIVRGDGSLSDGVGLPTPEEKALARVHFDLVHMLEMEKADIDSVEVRDDPRGVVISVREAALFEQGAEQLSPKSKAILADVGAILSRVPNQVRVEGHTDNSLPRAPFASNWELSTARATNVVKWMMRDYQVNPERFIAVGYGEYRPVASNDEEGGRLRNRRVDIVLLSDDSARLEAPLPNAFHPDPQERKIDPQQKPVPKTPVFGMAAPR